MSSSSSSSPPPGALAKIEGLAELNELFTAWVETVYHQRVRSEIGHSPMARFTAVDPPPLPTPAQLHEAFLWSERRTVAKIATVSLYSNIYEVDAALVGRRVELVFDPFDLTEPIVRYQGRDMGAAVAHQIGRHVHPDAKPDTNPQPAPVTGIDYLGLVRERHSAALAQRVDYAGLVDRRVEQVGRPEAQLEEELASFASLSASTATGDVHRDQLDLLTLIDDLDHDPQEQQ